MGKSIHKFGGDIIQFTGNSIVAIWLRNMNNEEVKEIDDSDRIVAKKATQCALDIKNEGQTQISKNTEILMGMGFGNCGILHVGGVFKRVEYFLIGEGLSQALRALKIAASDQPIIISESIFFLVHKNFVCDPAKLTQTNEKAVRYTYNSKGLRSLTNTLVLRTQIDAEKLKEIQMDLKTYIPAAFRPYLKLKKDTHGNEHRRITAMVLNIEMAYELRNNSTLNIIQKFITVIQQQIYRMEGSFNKIIAYDGGLQVIATWGISPISHEDDATRAVLAALNIQKRITYFAKKVGGLDYNPPLHIGICTGNVFLGIVGNEGSRKEIVTLGETIERAFLLMQAAAKNYGKLYVDYETKKEASLFMDFNYQEHIEFSNKLINQAIFEPVDPIVTDWLQPFYNQKSNDIMKMIRLHSHSFKVDIRNEYQHSYQQIYGSNDVIQQILQDISDYSQDPDENVWVLAIKGSQGSGKSLFARCLLSQVLQNKKDILKQRNQWLIEQAGDEEPSQITFYLMVSSCNSEIAKRFLGVWIPIIREIFRIYCKKIKKKSEAMLNLFIKHFDFVQIIEEIFGIKGLKRADDQIIIKEDPYQFVKVQSYQQDIEEDVIIFLQKVMKEMISKCKDQFLFLIMIDNASMMERASWRLFDLIASECDNLIIVMCIQSQNFGSDSRSKLNFKVSDNAYNFYQEKIALFEKDIFNVVEMAPLTEFDLRQILLDQAEQYEQDMQNEIRLMTQKIDSKHQSKTIEGQSEIQNQLLKKYQVYDYFKDIEKDIVVEVVKKCNGNPLLCISFLHQLLINGFIKIREKIFLSSNKLRYCLKTKNWNNIQLPPYALKMNCCLIESSFSTTGRYNKLSSEMTVQAYQILKSASVIGEIFSFKQLGILISQDYSQNYIIQLLIKEMEIRGLIELVYEDGYGDTIYRFTQSFLRETLFQLQIFDTQRKQTHSKIISYLQENLIYNWQTDWNFEKELVVLIQNLMNEEGVDNEKELSQRANQIIVMKKIKQINGAIAFDKIVNLTIINNDQLNSKKERKESKIHDEENLIERHAFQINCSEWLKNGYQVQKKSRQLIFLLNSKRKCEEWIAYIEYLRDKTSYDQFIQKFGNIKFQQKVQITEKQSNFINRQTFNTDVRFGSELQRSIIGSQQAVVILQKVKNQKLLFSKKKLKKSNTIKVNDSQQAETIDNLKNQLDAMYNILTLQFMNHLQTNACKYVPEMDDEQVSDISHIDRNLMIRQRILEQFPQPEEEFHEDSNIMMVQEDSTPEESKQEQDLDQMIEEMDQDDKQHTSQNVSLSPIFLKEQTQITRRHTSYEPIEAIEKSLFKLIELHTINQNGFLRYTTIKKKVRKRTDQLIQNDESGWLEFDNESIQDTLQSLLQEQKQFKSQKVALPIKKFHFNQGQEICQFNSHKNDIDTKQLNIRRREKKKLNLKGSPFKSQVALRKDNSLKEEVFLKGMKKDPTKRNIVSSINEQQFKQKDKNKHSKAHNICKVLEQGHKPIKQNKKQSSLKINQQEVKEIRKSSKQQALDLSGKQIAKKGDLDISSSLSLSFIQPIDNTQEERKTLRQKESKSKRYRKSSKTKRDKKPTEIVKDNKVSVKSPSIRSQISESLKQQEVSIIKQEEPQPLMNEINEIDQDIAQLDKMLLSEITQSNNNNNEEQQKPTNILNETGDSKCNLEDSEILKEQKASQEKFQINYTDRSPSRKIRSSSSTTSNISRQQQYQQQKQLEQVECIEDVQAIVASGNLKQKSVTITQGTILSVEKDLKELKLLQCKTTFENKQISVYMPRDSVNKQNVLQTAQSTIELALKNLEEFKLQTQENPIIYAKNFMTEQANSYQDDEDRKSIISHQNYRPKLYSETTRIYSQNILHGKDFKFKDQDESIISSSINQLRLPNKDDPLFHSQVINQSSQNLDNKNKFQKFKERKERRMTINAIDQQVIGLLFSQSQQLIQGRNKPNNIANATNKLKMQERRSKKSLKKEQKQFVEFNPYDSSITDQDKLS